MNYYLVIAKCGHVGHGKYIEKGFPVFAKSKHDAAAKVLRFPRVKKQLKNAISLIVDITPEEYREYRKLNEYDDYLKAKCRHQCSYPVYEVKELSPKVVYKKDREFISRLERIKYIKRRNRINEEVFGSYEII